MTQRRAVTLVGIGDDGCAGLTSTAVAAVAGAQVLVGGDRHLEFFPEFAGERIVLSDGLSVALDRVAALAEEQNICVLASGDPLFFGVGNALIKKVGPSHVRVIPQPSSMQLAFARAGLKWDDAAFLSLHGRPIFGLATKLKRVSKVAIFTDHENTPARIAAHLIEYGENDWTAWVCENLSGPDERVRAFALKDLVELKEVSPLNVLLLVRANSAWRRPASIPFFHEHAFAKRIPKKGLITKREVRLLSLAAMGIRPDSIVWDIGAGSGSLSIEAALLAPHGRVLAIEVDPEGAEICRQNQRLHGVDNVQVIEGRAPEALVGLEAPHAIFVGGSKGSMEDIIEVALERLLPGGRLVINAITLENASETYQAIRRRRLVPEVTLLQVSRAQPLAHYLRYEALNPIQVFAVEKPADLEETP